MFTLAALPPSWYALDFATRPNSKSILKEKKDYDMSVPEMIYIYVVLFVVLVGDGIILFCP